MSEENWWGKLSEKEQQEYLAAHPDSEKAKSALKEVISGMSEESRQEHEVAVNNIIKEPSKLIDTDAKQFDTENFKDSDKEKINGYLKKAKLTKDDKLALKIIAAAALITLTAAGALLLGVPVPDPVFAISSLMLMRDTLPPILNQMRNAKDGAYALADFMKGILEGMKEELKNSKKIKDALVPV